MTKRGGTMHFQVHRGVRPSHEAFFFAIFSATSCFWGLLVRVRTKKIYIRRSRKRGIIYMGKTAFDEYVTK